MVNNNLHEIRNGLFFAEGSVKTIYLHDCSIVVSDVTQPVENLDMNEGSSTLCLTCDLSLVLCRSWSFDPVSLAPGCIGSYVADD